jgi:hypothetical protein
MSAVMENEKDSILKTWILLAPRTGIDLFFQPVSGHLIISSDYAAKMTCYTSVQFM